MESGQAMIDGLRIYYNFVRPHMTLNGLTPAEVAKINLQLEGNKKISFVSKFSP